MNRILLILSVVGWMVGCAPKESLDTLKPPFRAQVLKMQPLKAGDPPTKAPDYAIEEVTFKDLKDIKTLQGENLKLSQGGEYRVSAVEGSIIETEEFFEGEAPRLRAKVKNGVVIPRDYKTLMLLSSYYQFDYVFSRLKDVTGLDIKDLKNSAEPVRIFYEPVLVQNGSTYSAEFKEKMNAAYDPDYFHFLLFKSSKNEFVPLSANFQVIAHEIGHLVWHRVFDHLKKDKKDDFSRERVTRGLNEGFADFISDLMSGTSNLLEPSFGKNKFSSQRNFLDVRFTFKQLYQGSSKEKRDVCAHDFYCIGTLFAKSLSEANRNLNSSNWRDLSFKTSFAKDVVGSLMQTKGRIQMNRYKNLKSINDTNFGPSFPANSIVIKDKMSYDGEVLGLFLQSFTGQFSSKPMRLSICRSLVKNFGEEGFPRSYRSECQP